MTRIVQVSDLHFGGEDAGALQVVEKFVAAEGPDLVIATGDLASAGLRSELEAAFAWLRTLGTPVLAVPGNHDVPYYSLTGRLIDPFRSFRESAAGAPTEWRNAACTVVGVNTARGVQLRVNWAQGAMSSRQTASAAAAFEAAGPAKLRVLASHHPLDWPNDAPIAGRTWGGLKAQRRLARAGVDVFLSGHLHVASARVVEGGRAVAVCGGTLSRRLRHEPCAFTLIEHDERGVSVTIMHVVNQSAEVAATRAFVLA